MSSAAWLALPLAEIIEPAKTQPAAIPLPGPIRIHLKNRANPGQRMKTKAELVIPFLYPTLIALRRLSRLSSPTGLQDPISMWWAFAIIAWTLLSLIASPLIGRALAGGRALEIREAGILETAKTSARRLA